LDGDISVIYKNASNVVNFLTVGDDLGDLCLLDRLNHFTYLCETDVFCMFISKDKLLEILNSNPKELLFSQRRANLRFNQTMSLRGKVMQARSTLLQKIKTQLADPKAFLKKLSKQESIKLLLDNNKPTNAPLTIHPSLKQPKELVGNQGEREDASALLIAKNDWVNHPNNEDLFDGLSGTIHLQDGLKPNSAAKKNHERNNLASIRMEETTKKTSDFLNTPLEIKKTASKATTLFPGFVESEERPPSKKESLKAEENSVTVQALIDNPAFDPLNIQILMQSKEIQKLRVAGEAIKELQMNFAALGTGFQSKLIKSTSLDKDAQELKYKKKQILSKVIRRTRHFEPDRLEAFASIPTAPFLEDLQTDSKQDKTPTKEKVRDFVFSEQNAPREPEKRDARRKKTKTGKIAAFNHKNIDRQKLLFVSRLNKEHLDGSLLEDSEEEPQASVGSSSS